MKNANFWLERDYLTVKVSSEGAFKDKNNKSFLKVWSNYNKKIKARLKTILTLLSYNHVHSQLLQRLW